MGKPKTDYEQYRNSLEGEALLNTFTSFSKYSYYTLAIIDPHPLLNLPGYDHLFRVVGLSYSGASVDQCRAAAENHPCIFDAREKVFMWVNPRKEEIYSNISPLFPWDYTFKCFPWDDDEDDPDDDDFDDEYDPDFDD